MFARLPYSSTSAQAACRARRDEGGFVLICVLWIVAILTLIALGFNRRGLLDVKASMYSLEYAQAQSRARGVVEYGVKYKRIIDILNGLRPDKEPHCFKQHDANDMFIYAEPPLDDCWIEYEDPAGRFGINSVNPEAGFWKEHPFYVSRLGDLRAFRERELEQARSAQSVYRSQYHTFVTVDELRLVPNPIIYCSDQEWYGPYGLRAKLSTGGGGRAVSASGAPEAVLEEVAPGEIAEIVQRRQHRSDGDGWYDWIGSMEYLKASSGNLTIVGYSTAREGEVMARWSKSEEVWDVVPWD